MAKPAASTLPRWASVPSTDPVYPVPNVVEPPTGKKDTGWLGNERPPNNWMNWIALQTNTWLDRARQDIRSTATRVVAAVGSEALNWADATADGTADDVEINGALAALAATGGRVVLTEGTFTLAAGLSVPANVVLEGQGEATIVRAVAPATASFDLVTLAGDGARVVNLILDGQRALQTTQGHSGIVAAARERVVVQGVRVRAMGNAAGGRGHAISLSDGAEPIVQTCHVEDCDGDGIALRDTAAAGAPSRGRVLGCEIEGMTGTGLILEGDYCVAAGCTLETDGVVVRGEFCALYGIVSRAASNAFTFDASGTFRGRHFTMTGCVANAPTADGVVVTGTGGTPVEGVIQGCVVRFAASDGIVLTNASGVSILGNQVLDSGFSGIRLVSSPNCVIDGNRVDRTAGHAIDQDSGSSNTLISGNRVETTTGSGFGIRLRARAWVRGNVVVAAYQGIEIVGVNVSEICDNRVQGSQTDGIDVDDSDDVLVHGNYLDSNGLLGGATYDVNINTSDRASVIGNRAINSGAGASRVEAAVRVQGTSLNVVVAGNHLQQGHTAGTDDGVAIRVSIGSTALPMPTTATVASSNVQY